VAATERVLLGLASLVLCLTACAPETREGEGLYISDAGGGFGQSQSPSTVAPGTTGGEMAGTSGTGGQPMTGMPGAVARTCVSLDLFSSRVTPQFTKDCVRCHDGTKGKATQLLNLTALRTGSAQAACDATLSTTNEADPASSTILSFANPDDPSTTHDFKYATSAEYAVYRDNVLAWLTTE